MSMTTSLMGATVNKVPGLISNGGDPYFEQVSLLFSPDTIGSFPYLMPNWGYATVNQPYTAGSNASSTIATPTTGMAWAPAVLSCTGGSTFTNMRTPVHAGYNLSNTDFTIEGWFRYTIATPTNTQYIFTVRDSVANAQISLLRVANVNQKFQLYVPGGFSVQFSGSNINAWNYFAITRSGINIKVWMNSTLVLNIDSTWTVNFTDAGSYFTFGAVDAPASTTSFAGQIGEIRVTKGTARYTTSGTLTVPTAAFPKWKDGYPKPTNQPVPAPTHLGSPGATTTITPSTWVGTPLVTGRWQTSSTLYSSTLWANVAGTTLTSPSPTVRSTGTRYIETATIGTLTTINYSKTVTAGWELG
jgi:hypothetical protein